MANRLFFKTVDGKYIELLKPEDMAKARVTKYVKRVPKPSGKGYYYFYTKQQFQEYKDKGVVPKEEGKKERSGILGAWSALADYFGITGNRNSDETAFRTKIQDEYSKHEKELKESGADISSFAQHLNEFLSNKDKWLAKFSGEKKEKSESKPRSEQPKSEKTEKKESTGKKWNMSIMKTIAGIYGSGEKKESGSKYSERKVFSDGDNEIYEVTINGKTRFEVPDKNTGTRAILDTLDEAKDEVEANKRIEKYKSEQKKEQESKVEAEKNKYDILGSWGETLSNKEKALAIKQLEKQFKSPTGKVRSAKDVIDEKIAEGWKVHKDEDGKESFRHPDGVQSLGGSMGNATITKYAVHRAKELKDEKPSKDNFDTMPEGEKKSREFTKEERTFVISEGRGKSGEAKKGEARNMFENDKDVLRLQEVLLNSFNKLNPEMLRIVGKWAEENKNDIKKEYVSRMTKFIQEEEVNQVHSLTLPTGEEIHLINKKNIPAETTIENVKNSIESESNQKPSATEALKEELGKKKSESKEREITVFGKQQKVKTKPIELNIGYNHPFEIAKRDFGSGRSDWVILESNTGLKVGDGKTQKEAIENAENMIKKYTPTENEFKKLIEKSLSSESVSKREKEIEKNKEIDKQIEKDFEDKSEKGQDYIKKDEAEKKRQESLKDDLNSSDPQKRYDAMKEEIRDFSERNNISEKEISKEWIDEERKRFQQDIKDAYKYKKPKEAGVYKVGLKELDNIEKYQKEIISLKEELLGPKMFKALSNLREELMFKAKYIKRIPSPKGKGYIYFYTQAQVKAYQKDGTIPDQGKKPEAEAKKEGKGNIEILKESVKKVASILADALSAKDAVQPTGAAVEQTGENVAAKSKEKKRLEEKSVPDKKKPDNKPEDKPKK